MDAENIKLVLSEEENQTDKQQVGRLNENAEK
jgi:hypothetical protein